MKVWVDGNYGDRPRSGERGSQNNPCDNVLEAMELIDSVGRLFSGKPVELVIGSPMFNEEKRTHE